jgi:hypothetical protein
MTKNTNTITAPMLVSLKSPGLFSPRSIVIPRSIHTQPIEACGIQYTYAAGSLGVHASCSIRLYVYSMLTRTPPSSSTHLYDTSPSIRTHTRADSMQEDCNSGDEGISSKPENDNKIAVENAFYEAQDLEVRLSPLCLACVLHVLCMSAGSM